MQLVQVLHTVERSLHLRISTVFSSSFYDLQPIIKSDCLGLSLVFNLTTVWHLARYLISLCFSSVAQSCLTLCDPTDRSMPGLTVHHRRPEFMHTHVHWVSDAIQPSHPLSSPYPPVFNHSQHQGLFKWVSSSLQVAKVLELQLHHQSFQWIFKTDLLLDRLVGSPWSPRDSQESSQTPQFKIISSSVLTFLYSPTLTSIDDY